MKTTGEKIHIALNIIFILLVTIGYVGGLTDDKDFYLFLIVFVLTLPVFIGFIIETIFIIKKGETK